MTGGPARLLGSEHVGASPRRLGAHRLPGEVVRRHPDDVDGASRSRARGATAGGWSSTSTARRSPLAATRACSPPGRRRTTEGCASVPTACRRSTWASRPGRPTSRCSSSASTPRPERATRPTRGSRTSSGSARAWSGSTTRPAGGWRRRTAGRSADPLALTDTGPVHVTTTASLRRLDAWAAELHDERVARALEKGDPAPAPRTALDMRRFRPNLVVDGDLEPFVEDGWATLRGRGRRAAVRRPLRAVRPDHDRPGHAGQGQGTARVVGAAPTSRRRGVVRHPDGPRARRRRHGRRPCPDVGPVACGT